MRKNLSIWSAVVALLAAPSFAQAADWGDLSLQFVVDGKSPAPKAIVANKDPEVCGKHKLVEETLSVGANGGISGIFVYLRSTSKVPVHPDYAATAKADVEIDNKGCRFEPHTVVLRVGQSLLIKNSDPIGHNTKIDFLSNPPINPIIPAGGMLKQSFKVEERLPASVSCSIHPWMTARLLVRDNPYAGATDADGKLTIKNVPAGKWEFQIWHEGAGFITEAKDSAGKSVKWSKGRVDWTIKAGKNDLGTFKVDSKSLLK